MDDKSKVGRPDRARLSHEEKYEWRYEVTKLLKEYPESCYNQINHMLQIAWDYHQKTDKSEDRAKIEFTVRGYLDLLRTLGYLMKEYSS